MDRKKRLVRTDPLLVFFGNILTFLKKSFRGVGRQKGFFSGHLSSPRREAEKISYGFLLSMRLYLVDRYRLHKCKFVKNI